MILEHFDEGRFSAVENMALDLLMLEAYPRPEALRLRNYSWEPDCFTFGYSQHYDWIALQTVRGAQLARRPTGGGLVDHRHDWTFALVIPVQHPFYHAPALDVYRDVHNAVAKALEAVGRPATLQPEAIAIPTLPGQPKRVRGLCFAGAEVGDVIAPETRAKICGAAMKRNHSGLLMQGSIDRKVAGELDWKAFREHFVGNLTATLAASEATAVKPPSYDAKLLTETIAKIGSELWNKRR